MRRTWWNAPTFRVAPGETLTLYVSEPGEFESLADFASRTILSCSLIGYLVVAQAPPRTLAELARAEWVVEQTRRFGGVDVPEAAECQVFALKDEADVLELAIGAGQVFVAFCWERDRDWLARQAGPDPAPDAGRE
jgi:hypothetical protein